MGLQVDAAGVGQQRSLKYFQGLARGCWLVSWAWVEGCAAAGQWLDEEPFELAGDHFALGAPRTGGSPVPPPFPPRPSPPDPPPKCLGSHLLARSRMALLGASVRSTRHGVVCPNCCVDGCAECATAGGLLQG